MKTNDTRKQLIKSLLMLFFAGVFISGLNAQENGDYRSKASGDYSDASSWETYNGSWGDAGAAPGYLNNVTIRNGHTILIDETQKSCKNLTVETGGRLWTSVSEKYFYTYGSQIVSLRRTASCI